MLNITVQQSFPLAHKTLLLSTKLSFKRAKNTTKMHLFNVQKDPCVDEKKKKNENIPSKNAN